ncbi:transcription factor Zn, C2H2 [Metarhizium guizhouense ARSEF 977]|uniref:Transcription factor Zn, C2H2 n=1 Tax=Metarhizium guizhouense (strain ARSEF 977) TaxID=1276136 RepID=A0A0B4HE63_METGA|nr:transcription factor Zn, C2H2 [Metarhizium guizhouense ARSEF 977]
MGPRSVFPWPGPLDSAATNHNILGADLNSLVSGSDASLTPPSETRSLASSPPRLSMTPEQQEMRRHRDRVRRESKLTSRMRRTDSASYTTSPPPMALNDVSNAIPLPIYSTAPQVSLLAEPSQALHNQQYLSSYNAALQEASHTSQMFTSSPYQSIPSTYSMPMDYPGIYSAPGDFSTRTPLSVAQDTGLLYSMPTVQPISHSNYSQEGSHVRVVQSRPKPRCWEHGCNGRQFSTFSNLLRHQREKSGQAAKATCPNCGAEFTRTTARNGHLLHDKCKQRRGNTSSN